MKRTAALITAPLILMLGLTACDDNKGTITPAQSEAVATEEAADADDASEEETSTPEIVINDYTSDETGPFLSATYPVKDGFDVTSNIQWGCVEALQQIQTEYPDLSGYTVQCVADADWVDGFHQIGSANFNGDDLQGLDLDTLPADYIWDTLATNSVLTN